MIGIIGAIPEEVNAIINEMQISESRKIGNRIYTIGKLEEQEIVVVFSRIGKVAAAITTTTLIHEFKIKQLIFTGVAGGLANEVTIGDIVLATNLGQHDFNAFPLYPKNEIPLTNKKLFKTNTELTEIAKNEIEIFIERNNIKRFVSKETLLEFKISNPKIHLGLIVSGDQFIHEKTQVEKILSDFPNALCVEMEGTAVAQVCYEYKIPFTVIRTISDHANETASLDFNKFINQVSNVYGLFIVKHILQKIKPQSI